MEDQIIENDFVNVAGAGHPAVANNRVVRQANLPALVVAGDVAERAAAHVPAAAAPHAAAIQPPAPQPVVPHQQQDGQHRMRGFGHNTEGTAGGLTKDGSTIPPSLQVLTRVFREPIREISPRYSSIHCDTGTYKITWKGQERDASPMTWCDMLRFGRTQMAAVADPVHAEFDYHTPEFPFTVVSVTNNSTSKVMSCAVSDAATLILAKGESEITNTAVITGLIPRPGLMDQQQLLDLLRAYALPLMMSCVEEVALLRAYCLMATRLKPEFYRQASDMWQSTQFACGSTEAVPVVRWSTTWTVDDVAAVPGCRQIPNPGVNPVAANQQCVMKVLTLTEFIRCAIGTRPVAARDEFVYAPDVVIIPIKKKWEGTTWLIPYIMSFLTTRFWNGAVVVEGVPNDAKFADIAHPTLSGIIESSLWVMDGAFHRVYLVICDLVGGEQIAENWVLSEHYAINRRVGTDITAFLYRQLGRDPVDPPAAQPAWWADDAFSANDVHQAAQHIERYFHTPVSARLTRSKFALMVGSFPLGYSVHTGGANARPANGVFLSGVRAYNINAAADANRFGGAGGAQISAQGDDWNANANWIKGFGFWRVNAFGMMHKSKYTLGRNNVHWPSMSVGSGVHTDHSASTMTSGWRVLSMCGLVKTGVTEMESMTIGVLGDPYELMQYVLGHATLLAGISGWLLCELGCPIVDLNGFAPFTTHVRQARVPTLYNIVTDGFIGSDSCRSSCYLKSADFRGIICGHLGLTNNTWTFSNWLSIHVPFHFIRAVILKFGLSVNYVNRGQDTSVPTEVEDVDEPDLIGKIQAYYAGMRSGWFDTALLCESLMYEKRVKSNMIAYFPIRFPANNGDGSAVARFTGWYPHTRFDEVKVFLASGEVAEVTSVSDGYIELLAVVIPYIRNQTHASGEWKYIISPQCHQRREDQKSWIEIVSFTEPDPNSGWLGKLAWSVVPNMVLGGMAGGGLGVISGLGQGLIHYAVKSGFEWLKEQVYGDVDDAEIPT